ncbi:MAG: prepilin peptidase [Ilumatobacter sp.]|uniref:prepilin peptidase n=1 Tax=Ilumatobacter sp. TaxID=1967498 RepID=UPI00391C3965
MELVRVEPGDWVKMDLSLLLALMIVLGLLIGSFLTVVVDRVPRGGSVMAPPSACGNCDLRLGPLDLVPVFSWLVLRGKCRRCKNPIGIEPIVIELATAALFVVFALKFNDDLVAALPAYCIFAAALVALSWIDIREQRLPREITFTALLLGAPALAIAAIVIDEPERIWMSALGAAIALALIAGIYYAANWRYGKDVAFGFGDVILSPLLGLFMGWLNPGIVAPGLFFGFILGTLGAIPAMVARKATGKTALPFGPFLAAGAVIAVFVGQHFVDLVLAR